MIEYVVPDEYKEVISDNLKKNRALPYEIEGIRKDGTRIALELESRNIRIDEGSTIRVTAVRDISYRKELEQKLKESERRFRQYFEKSGEALMLIENGELVRCNNTAVSLFGYDTEEELLATSITDISPEKQPDGRDSLEKAAEMIRTAIKKGTYLFEWIHKREKRRYVLCRGFAHNQY